MPHNPSRHDVGKIYISMAACFADYMYEVIGGQISVAHKEILGLSAYHSASVDERLRGVLIGCGVASQRVIGLALAIACLGCNILKTAPRGPSAFLLGSQGRTWYTGILRTPYSW